jgi:hypothetical protein
MLHIGPTRSSREIAAALPTPAVFLLVALLEPAISLLLVGFDLG